jgi:hypothetical protein
MTVATKRAADEIAETKNVMGQKLNANLVGLTQRLIWHLAPAIRAGVADPRNLAIEEDLAGSRQD